jgi:stearoyl-CoA desaturase (delta-9 desaturase)
MFQHKHYLTIAILSGFIIPMIWGFLLGDFWGGFLFIGLIRIVLGHHTTFLVNSLCHISGSQPYSIDHSAKDNLLVALLTNGEGYHNFHHSFEGDYRNGALWYHWDPTKWTIKLLSYFGQTYKLRKVSREAILRSRLQADQVRLQNVGMDTTRLKYLQDQIETMLARINQLKGDYELVKVEYRKKAQDWEDHSRARVIQLRADLELAKIELENKLLQWQRYMSLMQPVLG